MINRTQSRLIAKERRNFKGRKGTTPMRQEKRGHRGPIKLGVPKSSLLSC